MAKILVKMQNGDEMKGDLLSFNANLPTFYLVVEKEGGKTFNTTVPMRAVKSIFFLKKEEGEGSLLRTETIDQSVFSGSHGFRIDVEFKDGDTLHGSAHKYSPNDKGFYLVPLNPGARYDRIYVNARAVKNVESRKFMGKILVDQDKITPAQLEHALQHQQAQREKKLGTILREKNYISQAQLEESLNRQKERSKMLGEILLDAGYISDEQLEDALRVQRLNRSKKLGQILVELKYLAPNDICIALSTQLQVPWADLSAANIPAAIATALPAEVVRHLEVIPIEQRNHTLVVATSMPQEPGLRGEISRYTDLDVELAVAYEGYIQDAINRFFPATN